MKISQTFAGSYLKAADVPSPMIAQIVSVQMGKMPEGDEKPVISFTSGQQLVMNKTNATILAELWGDETANWHGQWVEIYATQTSFGGRVVPCIRVRAPQQPAAPQPQPTPQPAVPSSPPVAVPQQPAAPPPAPAADYPVDA